MAEIETGNTVAEIEPAIEQPGIAIAAREERKALVGFRARMAIYGLVVLAALAGVYIYKRLLTAGDTSTYMLTAPKVPSGWTRSPHSALMVFLYTNKANGSHIMASANSVTANYVVDPETSAEGAAKQIEDSTAKLPGWKVFGHMPNFDLDGIRFVTVVHGVEGKRVAISSGRRGNTNFFLTFTTFGKGDLAKERMNEEWPLVRRTYDEITFAKERRNALDEIEPPQG